MTDVLPTPPLRLLILTMLAKLVSASHKWLLGLSSMLPNNRILPEDKSKADGQTTDVFYI
ncbi:hypothetical protein GCM10023352_20360 [Rothia endophytica]|uniref:Uncharacterized protein n=1 Tax=Rothia endophytica TaxID=1324766 RepID=A0ABP9BWF6_9MICC